MSFNTFLAIRFTPSFAQETGWPDHFEAVCSVLGFKNQYPTPLEFVKAIHQWQSHYPSLVADGILGPQTWKVMWPVVKGYQGTISFTGSRPDWVKRIKPQLTTSNKNSVIDIVSDTSNLGKAINNVADKIVEGIKIVASGPKLPINSLPQSQAPNNAEDILIKEMIAINAKESHDPYTPIEVSSAYAQHAASIQSVNTLSTMSASAPWFSGAVGTLQVGQVWPGIKGGTRIILSLTPGFSTDNTLCGEILFVTESGRFYVQTLEGWVSDYTTAFITGLSKSLAPLQTMLDVEATFLLGAISATNAVAAGYVITANIFPWCYKNRDSIRIIIGAIYVLYRASNILKNLAPTLYKTVIWGSIKLILSEVPNSALSNERNMAFFIGQMVWKLGKVIITRESSVLLDGLKVTMSYVVIPALKKSVMPALGAAAKAIPGAAVAAAKTTPGFAGVAKDAIEKELGKKLQDAGISITVEEVSKIIQEIRKNPSQIEEQFNKLKVATENLISTITSL